MPPQDAFALLVAAGFAFIYGRIWLRRRREAPLRRELKSRNATFRANLERVKVSNPEGWPKRVSVTAPMTLYVRGDMIEISSAAAYRVLMGLEYYFPAAETSLEVSRGPSRLARDDWLVLTGWRDGKDFQVAFTCGTGRRLLDAWNALTGAGAIAAGLPPRVTD